MNKKRIMNNHIDFSDFKHNGDNPTDWWLAREKNFINVIYDMYISWCKKVDNNEDVDQAKNELLKFIEEAKYFSNIIDEKNPRLIRFKSMEDYINLIVPSKQIEL